MSLTVASKTASLNALRVLFGQAARAARPFYPRICNFKPSDGAKEIYGLPGSVAAVREWVGERVWGQLAAAEFELTNQDWEWSHKILRNHYEDDRFGLYDETFAGGGKRFAHHPDKLAIEKLVSNGECWDGQNFFDSDHSWNNSGSQTNLYSQTAATGTTPNEAEFLEAYHGARAQMLALVDDQGEPLNETYEGQQSQILCLVPPALQFTAEKAFTASILDNDTNVVLDRPSVVASPRLTNAAVMYMIDLSGPARPLIFQLREAPHAIQFRGIDDRRDKNIEAYTDGRYAVGYYAWWTAVKVTFT